MTTNERVDVTSAVQDARRQAERWATEDPAYAELMSTYGDIGEALDEEDLGELPAVLRDLWVRANAMGRRCEAEFEQAAAIWRIHHMTSDGSSSEQ